MKLTLTTLAAVAAAGLSSGAGAITPTPPTYTERYTFATPYTLSDPINANTYIPYDDGSGGGVGFTSGGPLTDNGDGTTTLTDPFLKENNIASTYFMGTSALGTDSPNHLVIAVSDSFALHAAGVTFEEVFGGDYSEAEVIGALNALYNPGSDDDAHDAAVSTIFGFSDTLFDDDAGFSPNGDFTLLGFSEGVVVGTGVASLVDTSAPAVPEPASWALMIGGFGLVGGALRTRHAEASRLTA